MATYLKQLVADDVFVRQAVYKRERVIDCHGDVRPQLPQQGPGVTAPKGFYSGHDLSCVPNWAHNDSAFPSSRVFQMEEVCLSPQGEVLVFQMLLIMQTYVAEVCSRKLLYALLVFFST